MALQGLQVTEHGGNQLRDGWVNVHGALHHCVRSARIHQVKDAVNYLVATGSENGGAEYLRCWAPPAPGITPNDGSN
jgi:hypothetical protein